jgi:type II secretory pathway pseudopilin PulG
MQRAFGGYTLIEVMIFLAISSVILVMGVYSVRGQTAHTEFATSVNEVNVKFQQWIDDVANGYSSNSSVPGAPNGFTCTIQGNPKHPHLTNNTSTERGYNSDCIFMGKAILVNDTKFNNQIFAIPIVGLRTNGAGDLTSTIVDAGPIGAVDDAGNFSDVDLSETYTIPNGTRVLSSHTQGCLTNCSYMGGFFTSLNSGTAGNGAQSLLAAQYPMKSNDQRPFYNAVKQCLALRGSQCNGPPPNLWPMTTWQICLTSTRNDERALLSIISSDGLGAKTQLKTGKSNVCS